MTYSGQKRRVEQAIKHGDWSLGLRAFETGNADETGIVRDHIWVCCRAVVMQNKNENRSARWCQIWVK